MKTRFAPSPTGYIHLGNARTALFSFLLAKSTAGQFLLRIEDSDVSRSLASLSEQVQSDLLWLDLPWQEGPGKEGSHGPYFQSKRQSIYTHYYHALEKARYTYACFCTEQELASMRKHQLLQGKPPRYTGACRHLNASQIAEKKAQNKKQTLRFHVTPSQRIHFNDLVKGEQTFASDDIGDFVIQRSDGSAAFFFCNAIDDALMGVTHVLRGEDHLTNTPRQIILLQALGLPVPAYGHMSLIVGGDGAPLSKRHGSFSINALRKLGYFPSAIQNYLARLGHTYTHADFMDMQELAEKFTLARLGKSPAHYDHTQLLYWQKQAILRCDEKQLITWMGDEVKQAVPHALLSQFTSLMRHNIALPKEALQWTKILFSELIFSQQACDFLKQVPLTYWETTLSLLQDAKEFKALVKGLQNTLKIKGKDLFAPLRMALTGCLDGPEMEKIYTLIDFEKKRQRIIYAKNL